METGLPEVKVQDSQRVTCSFDWEREAGMAECIAECPGVRGQHDRARDYVPIIFGRACACADSTSGPSLSSERAVRMPERATHPGQTTSGPAVRVHMRVGMFR